MIKISLTDFVDFAVSSGSTKLTKVRQVKSRPDYNPATDYWRPLRKAIIDYHERGETDKKRLDDVLKDVKDEKKLARYPECIAGYKGFLGKKTCEWNKPQHSAWIAGDLVVSINPELRLMIDGQDHFIKLYFKADPLAKSRTAVVLLLMREALHKFADDSSRFSILDVTRSKLHSEIEPDPALLPLLLGEAASFVTIWESL